VQRYAVLCLQVVLSFYEKRVRQQWGLAFGKQEERLFWEQWCVRCLGFRVKAGSACAHPGLPCSSRTSCACLMSMFWEQWRVRAPRQHRSSVHEPAHLTVGAVPPCKASIVTSAVHRRPQGDRPAGCGIRARV
jgi:Autophagy-related protein 101